MAATRCNKNEIKKNCVFIFCVTKVKVQSVGFGWFASKNHLLIYNLKRIVGKHFISFL